MTDDKIGVCFVCLGNICRSPTAEGVMLQLIAEAGLLHRFEIDSSGTGAYHAGERADARSRAAAKARGIELLSVSRQFVAQDFERFHYIVAMDSQNLAHLQRMAQTPEHKAKLSMLRSFDPQASAGEARDVPDPYYLDNFDEVFDICRAGCSGLLADITQRHGLEP